MSTSRATTCIKTTAGAMVCWGSDNRGLLGNGGHYDGSGVSLVPAAPATLQTF